MSNGNLLLIYAVLSILALVVLIARYRLNPFISVTVVSVGLALLAGMPAPEILPAYEQGVGKTLGHIALIVALGTMLGKMMAESGGAERIARTLIARFGPKNVHWAMMLIAFCVGLPIFFEVGFVLLIPIVLNVARRTGVPLLLVGLPMVAGLSVVHGLVPPTPGGDAGGAGLWGRCRPHRAVFADRWPAHRRAGRPGVRQVRRTAGAAAGAQPDGGGAAG
ncbi:SLC13 family permease [Stenotrophomonas pictorum]|uniref:GntT/GntP/DsdX family permease n=1 Tax=Stenotrophomonas pictorum TaxID=86184 RepID=UPI000A82D943